MSQPEDSKSPKLRPELYWEWRCTIEELERAKLKEKSVHQEKEIKHRDMEILKLRTALFRTEVSSARQGVIKAQDEYKRMKEKIEKEIGMSLNNCVIDDISYEVKKIDEQPDQP